MKPISGKESSILALIAQSKDISEDEISEILSHLSGRSLSIAKTILKINKSPTKSVKLAADGFINWANNLGKIHD